MESHSNTVDIAVEQNPLSFKIEDKSLGTRSPINGLSSPPPEIIEAHTVPLSDQPATSPVPIVASGSDEVAMAVQKKEEEEDEPSEVNDIKPMVMIEFSESAILSNHAHKQEDPRNQTQLVTTNASKSTVCSEEESQRQPLRARQAQEKSTDIDLTEAKHVVYDLCRFCANPYPGCVSIYSEEGVQMNLLEKIRSSLQQSVEEEDMLPKTLCLLCLDKLDSCYQFIQQVTKSYESLIGRLESNGDLDSIFETTESSVKLEPLDVNEPLWQESDSIDAIQDTKKRKGRGPVKKRGRKRKMKKDDDSPKDKKPVVKKRGRRPKKDMLLDRNRKHAILNSNPALCICVKCDASFSSHRENLDHWHQNHPGVPIEYACREDSCQFQTLHLWDIKSHVKEHLFQAGEIGQCEICAKYFPHKQMKMHIANVHVSERVHECSVCHKKFKTYKMLKSHEKQHAPDDEKYQFSCHHCGKQFIQQGNLDMHMLRHMDRKPYQCDECERGFYTVQDLKYHKYTHTGERPFQCSQCEQTFIRNGDLDKHVKTKHLNQLRFQCSYCPVKYNRKDQLRAHELGHTGETPFRCDICGRGFRRKDKLKQHMGVHLPEEDKYRFPCHLCGKRYTENGNLKVHLKSHAHQNAVR